MVIGIVGSEAAKFTALGAQRAKATIHSTLTNKGVSGVSSGACHLGGIDIWAEEEGRRLGLDLFIYPPANLSWSGGYQARNMKIAAKSDVVICITVDRLPETYKGMTFECCYHCVRYGNKTPHVKSGGCWTMWHAKIKHNKTMKLIVIGNY